MMQINTQINGQYKYVVTHADGSVEESTWFDNLILDVGLNTLGASNEVVFSYAQVGTGTSAVTSSQTKLQTFLQSAPISYMSTVNTLEPLHKAEHLYQAIFPQGEVIGVITEFGVGREPTGVDNIFSRALISDVNNQPTSISVVELDQLTMYYKVIITPPLAQTTGTFVVSGEVYNYTARVANVDSFSNGHWLASNSDSFSLCTSVEAFADDTALGLITESLQGTSLGSNNSVVHVSYSPATKTRTSRVVFSSGTCNHPNGIKGLGMYFNYYGCRFQYVLDKPIPKTETTELTLDVSFSWARG